MIARWRDQLDRQIIVFVAFYVGNKTGGKSQLPSVIRKKDQSQQDLELVEAEMVEQGQGLEMVEKGQEPQDVPVYQREWEEQGLHPLQGAVQDLGQPHQQGVDQDQLQ